jgi:predicted anti-sigma-YlaC factor YlaD
MTCKHFQAMMLDQRSEPLSGPVSRSLSDHLKQCRECRVFQREISRLRQGCRSVPEPVLPDPLERATRRLCHRRIEQSNPVPRPVYWALASILILTLVVIFPAMGKQPLDSDWSPGEVLGLILVLQNAVMLLFSPLLIRRQGRFSALTGGLSGGFPGLLSKMEVENGK